MRLVNQIIREIREDRDLTQAEIAAVLKVQQQYYSKYETGEYEFPVRHVIALAKYYNVTTDYLLGLTDYSHGLDNLNKPLVEDITTGRLLSGVLNLDSVGRKAVVEYINLVMLKQSREKTME